MKVDFEDGRARWVNKPRTLADVADAHEAIGRAEAAGAPAEIVSRLRSIVDKLSGFEGWPPDFYLILATPSDQTKSRRARAAYRLHRDASDRVHEQVLTEIRNAAEALAEGPQGREAALAHALAAGDELAALLASVDLRTLARGVVEAVNDDHRRSGSTQRLAIKQERADALHRAIVAAFAQFRRRYGNRASVAEFRQRLVDRAALREQVLGSARAEAPSIRTIQRALKKARDT